MKDKTNVIDEHSASLREMIAEHIARVRATIEGAAGRVGRKSDEITLVAVSKSKPLELVKIAYELGVTNFGENRVQEGLEKIAAFHPPNMRWHMIGHLQSNKAGKVATVFDYVHSVDSLHLAQVLDRHVGSYRYELDENRAQPRFERSGSTVLSRLPVLLQVNVSGEKSKEGMTPAEVLELARRIITLPHLEVQGLMTVAPFVNDPEEVRPVFRALRELRDRLRDELPSASWHHLSMGMTDDYSVAIEEGATIVRIGRAIFGERVKPV